MTDTDAPHGTRLPTTECYGNRDSEVHVWPYGNIGPCQCGRIADGRPRDYRIVTVQTGSGDAYRQ